MALLGKCLKLLPGYLRLANMQQLHPVMTLSLTQVNLLRLTQHFQE